MASVGTPARAPFPGAKAPVVYVCQVVVVVLSIRPAGPATPDETSTAGLHVLVRTAESQGARSDTDWVLPRRWAGRPSELDSVAWRAVEYSGLRALNAPVAGAATLFDQVVAVRPAGGLVSVVATMLLQHDRLLAPEWDWAPIHQLDPVLGEWDRTAVTAGREKAREMLRDTDTVLRLLPDQFRISELRGIYEAVWGTELDPSNFAKRALLGPAKGFLEPIEQDHGKPGRPATLYRRGHATAPRLAPA